MNPEDSVDHHLLNKLASFLKAEIIVISNPVNPHLQTHYVSPQRYLNERPPSPKPLILSLVHLHKTSLLRELLQATSNLPRLMIFTEHQRRILRLDLDSYNLCVSAPPFSITRVPKWYWYGERRLIPTKNTVPSTIYMALENFPMTEADYDTIDAILSVRRIDDAATTTLPLPELDPGTPYFPETPQGFRDTLFSHEMAKRLAVMAGGIPQHILGWLRRDIPPSDTPSLLRQLRYTLLEHQFQTWALRNEAQPIRDHRPSYARPKRPPRSPQKAQPKPLRKKRKRRSKEDTWNQRREFWKRSKFFLTPKPPQASVVRRPNIRHRREEAASPPNARQRRRYDPGGDGEG